jgi:uncharacterized protein YbjT (DUF2867 family)
MKLIVSGSTGFIGTEVLRQALSHPAITEIISLARRETAIPPNLAPDANPAKLKSVVCNDFLNYPESVRTELRGADACIWLVWCLPLISMFLLERYVYPTVRSVCLASHY